MLTSYYGYVDKINMHVHLKIILINTG